MDRRDVEESSPQAMADLLAMAIGNAPDEEPRGQPSSDGEAASSGELPRQLGEYRLLSVLGKGGMGTVYKALHTEMDRVVALKVIQPGRTDEDWALARFRREIKAVGRLDHPNVVRAHDARRIGETQVLVMEYVDGIDLGSLVARLGPLPIADACELTRQAASGLQAAQDHELVHRDVKPSNVMLSRDGAVKILDLGLARVRGPSIDQDTTISGMLMGTPDYMAPEQISDSRVVDIRADIYSLGCTLYQLLTGHPPFDAPEYRTPFEKMNAHVSRSAPPVEEQRGDVPSPVVVVLNRMLSKDPSERFASPREVAEGLAAASASSDLRSLAERALGDPPAERKTCPGGGDTSRSAATCRAVARREETPPQRETFLSRTKRWLPAIAIAVLVLAFAAFAAMRFGLSPQTIKPTEPSGVGSASSPSVGVQTDPALGEPQIPAVDAEPSLPGWIVMSWTRPGLGKPNLWLFCPDGKQRINISNEPRQFDIHPKFSPDGRRIAFIRGDDPMGPNGVWVCNADGSQCRQIVSPQGESERFASPVWVSNSLVFYARDPNLNRAPDMEIWQVDLDRSPPTRVFRFQETLGRGYGLITDVSPDGRQLAVIAQSESAWSASDVFVCNSAGMPLQTLWTDTSEQYKDARALWSSEGRMIAWHHNFTPGTEAEVMHYGIGLASQDPNGSWHARLQADARTFVTPLAWSPDGKRLLCAHLQPTEQLLPRATLVCTDENLVPSQILFRLEAAVWQPGHRDFGRIADWAVVPDDVGLGTAATASP